MTSSRPPCFSSRLAGWVTLFQYPESLVISFYPSIHRSPSTVNIGSHFGTNASRESLCWVHDSELHCLQYCHVPTDPQNREPYGFPKKQKCKGIPRFVLGIATDKALGTLTADRKLPGFMRLWIKCCYMFSLAECIWEAARIHAPVNQICCMFSLVWNAWIAAVIRSSLLGKLG